MNKKFKNINISFAKKENSLFFSVYDLTEKKIILNRLLPSQQRKRVFLDLLNVVLADNTTQASFHPTPTCEKTAVLVDLGKEFVLKRGIQLVETPSLRRRVNGELAHALVECCDKEVVKSFNETLPHFLPSKMAALKNGLFACACVFIFNFLYPGASEIACPFFLTGWFLLVLLETPFPFVKKLTRSGYLEGVLWGSIASSFFKRLNWIKWGMWRKGVEASRKAAGAVRRREFLEKVLTPTPAPRQSFWQRCFPAVEKGFSLGRKALTLAGRIIPKLIPKYTLKPFKPAFNLGKLVVKNLPTKIEKPTLFSRKPDALSLEKSKTVPKIKPAKLLRPVNVSALEKGKKFLLTPGGRRTAGAIQAAIRRIAR